MISIFRKFRKDLMAKNRFSKYLLYALGEILLVVIGILIALQINTWNDERALRKKERIYLREIKANLSEDLQNIRIIVEFNQSKDSALDTSIERMLNANSDFEIMSGISRNMNLLSEFKVFQRNRVAFDNMLSAENIDIISEDTIRSLISTYYAEKSLLNGTQERVKELTRGFVDDIGPLLMTKDNIDMLFEMDSDWDTVGDLDFRKNKGLIYNLFTMKRVTGAQMEFLNEYERGIQRIMRQIDQFLSLKE